MDSLLIHLNYPFDKQGLLESAKLARVKSKPYTDSRFPNLSLDNWHIGRYNDDLIQKIMDDFEVNGKPRFYWLEPYANIPEHVDNETQCSINLILTDSPSPVTIAGDDILYTQALLNTTVPHSVVNGSEERIMLKISIFDETYKQLATRIKYKL